MIRTEADNEEQDAILSMRMDAMLNSSPASFLSIIGALFAVYAYWTPPAAAALIVWLFCIVGVAVTNVVSTFLYARKLPSTWGPRSWARFVRVMHLVSGLTWGIGGAWMLTFANVDQALLTLAIGLAAVTMSIPSVVCFRAYNLFHLPIFWTYAVGIALSTLQFKWLISSGFVLLGAFAIVIGRDLGDQLTNALRLSIENKRLADSLEERGAALEAANRQLEIDSRTDPLTGIANRRHLMSFARAIRGRCAILVIDVDHFKSYNDSFGHVEGDTCLVAVAGALERWVRPRRDLVARLGGEEFAVVLDDIAAGDAVAIAEAMRASVESLNSAPPGQDQAPGYRQHRSRDARDRREQIARHNDGKGGRGRLPREIERPQSGMHRRNRNEPRRRLTDETNWT